MTVDEVKTLVMIAREHNRQPGTFDYRYPQTFFSTFPEIDSESYITLGAGDDLNGKRRVHTGVETKVYN